jgi:hypothetical protein
MARPKRFEFLTPRFVVSASPIAGYVSAVLVRVAVSVHSCAKNLPTIATEGIALERLHGWSGVEERKNFEPVVRTGHQLDTPEQ